MKFSWRTEWPLWLLLAAMFLMAAFGWMHAPDRIPVHWGANGEVDRYGGKFEGILLIPLVGMVIYLLFLFLPRIDPARANYARFAGAYTVIRFTILLFLTLIYFVMHLETRGNHVSMELLVPILVGGLFVVMGSVFRKIHPNWFVGIRTPWTLTSRKSWTETHRVGGWVFIVAGILLMGVGVIHYTAAILAVIVVFGVGMLGTVIYSYFVWRDDPDRSSAGTLHSP